MMAAMCAVARAGRPSGGSWRAALALFFYAAAFSFAYVSLPAGVGALLLFGAVQVTMVMTGIVKGEHPTAGQWLGLLLALAGLAALVAPGVSAPPFTSAVLMLGAGVAWGALFVVGSPQRGSARRDSGQFSACGPDGAPHEPAAGQGTPPFAGLIYALLSGAVASGVGYTIWYAALPGLSAAEGASVQLSVPVITALAGATLLAEPISSASEFPLWRFSAALRW